MKRVAKLLTILAVPPYLSALLPNGVAAAVEHASVLAHLDCMTVVDVGANRGQFALVARRCFPQAWIHSFEPLSEPMRSYRRVLGNDPRIATYQVALGCMTGEATMHVPRNDDSSSLLSVTTLQRQLHPGTTEESETKVRVGQLPDYIGTESLRSPALLKIDVQGYEMEVLRGCHELIEFFSYVYVECAFVELYEGQALADEIVAWLREQHFNLRGIHNITFDHHGQAVDADFLFVRHSTNVCTEE